MAVDDTFDLLIHHGFVNISSSEDEPPVDMKALSYSLHVYQGSVQPEP